MSHPFITGLAIYGCYEALRKVGLVKDIECPEPVKDPDLNKKNKIIATQEHFYGPDALGRPMARRIATVKNLPLLAPSGHPHYWAEKALRKRIMPALAEKQLCGNCKAFNITPEMVACGGASERPILVECAKGGAPRLTTSVGSPNDQDFP